MSAPVGESKFEFACKCGAVVLRVNATTLELSGDVVIRCRACGRERQVLSGSGTLSSEGGEVRLVM